MRKAKTTLLAALLLALMIVMTGCGDKTPLTLDEFKTAAEEYGCEIKDVSDQYASFDYIETAALAVTDNWQVEFMVLIDERAAIGSFNANKESFEQFKGSASAEASSAIGNHASYTLTSGGYYMCVCRIDNTIVYANVSSDCKDDVKNFIKNLGY